MWRTHGHDPVVELLQASLAQGRVAHAYLITGPDHVGKATLARELAMALNCTAWQGEPEGSLFGGMELDPATKAVPGPCYECAACRKALAGGHPDLQVFEQWTTEGGRIIDQIRGIQYASGLRPFEGRWKVYVLLNAQDLTLPAQNALLKTLEEPAPSVCLILTAVTAQALLPTVVSRCQHIQLRAPSLDAIAAALRDLRSLPPEDAEKLAGLAAGRIGWALLAAEEPALLEARQTGLRQLHQLFAAPVADRFRLAEALAAQAPEAIDDTLQLWLAWLRDALLMAEGAHARVVNQDELPALERAAGDLGSRDLQASIRAVQRARWQVDSSVNTRMALEVLMLRLPALGQQVGSAL